MSESQHNMTRRSFMGLQAATLGSLLAGCSADEESTPEDQDQVVAFRSLEEMRAAWTLRVGVYSDNKPFCYMGSKGTYEGYDPYFCLLFRERTGCEPDYVAVDPCTRYDVLASGRVDVMLAEMSPSDVRADEALFTRPFMKLQLGVVSPIASPIDSVDQLADKTLIVCEGSYAEQFAEETWPEVTLKSYKTISDAFVALKNGGDALLGDELTILSWLKSHDDYTLALRQVSEPRYISAAVPAGQDEVRDFIDEQASAYIANAYSNKAYSKYVEPNIPGGFYGYKDVLCGNGELEENT